MATISKLSYLKRYMSKEDLEDLKMKNKVKKKLLSDMEKRKTDGDRGETQSKAVTKKPSTSIPKKKKRLDSDSDDSSPRKPMAGRSRKVRHDSDLEDQSPARKSVADPLRKPRHDSDSDPSPLRRRRPEAGSDSDQSPPRKTTTSVSRKRHDSDSDQSPPRQPSGRNRHDSSSDQSPPRKTSRTGPDSDGDHSPPRRHQPPPSSSSRRGERPSRFTDLSPPRSKMGSTTTKATKTMSGATAGLSSAAEMKREAKVLREKEDRSFQKIDDEVLGRNAKTVVRDRQTGKRRNMEAEKEVDEEKEKRMEMQKEKYQQWGQGLSQQEEKERRLADHIHEASKPLARYHDDKDLDTMLRNQQRAEDPMLAFIQRKKAKEDSKGGSAGKPKKELPVYKGRTAPPPNRYNIMPGYRWDGVDRSNGFEKKYFDNINNKKAIKEMAYKWSTEDM